MTLTKLKINQQQKQIEAVAWAQQVLEKNLKQPKTIEVEGPAIVKVEHGIEVHIDTYNNVTIVGQNSLKFKCEGDMEFEADNITMKAKESYHIDGGKSIIQKADRIDLNPKEKK